MDWIRAYRRPFLENWFDVNGTVYFILLCLLYFTSFMLKRMFIFDSIAAFEVMEERGEMWIFDLFFALEYLIVPVFLAWKFTLTAFLLWTGCFMFGYKITFRQLWKMVMVFELVFIIPEFLKTFWFMSVQSDPTYQDFIAFYPLSLQHAFPSSTPAWTYPLKALNVFEVMYWLLLMLGIFWISDKKIKISAIIVSTSYIFLFLLWLCYYVVVYR